MNATTRNKTLILGGAGFIGSSLARRLAREGHDVTVLDGFMPQTGGMLENLEGIDGIEIIPTEIKKTNNLPEVLVKQDCVIDCMAWTSHRAALKNTVYDMELNLHSHLTLLEACGGERFPRIIYLGSRSQYGNPNVSVITESTEQIPLDPQGIHKLAAESHFKLACKTKGISVASLRFGNCFGPRQKASGDDIGLVGDFIRQLLKGGELEIYGGARERSLIYVDDLCEVVVRLMKCAWAGFLPLNLGGRQISIGELAKLLVEIVGSGSIRDVAAPVDISAIEIGSAKFDDTKLKSMIGPVEHMDLREALHETLQYFRGVTE